MVYEFTDEVRDINIRNISPANKTVAILNVEELKENNDIFGFSDSTIAECENKNKTFKNAIDAYDDYSFGVLNIVDVKDVYNRQDRIGFFIKRNLIIIVDVYDEDQSTTEAVEYAVDHFRHKHTTMEKIQYIILERIIHRDGETLAEIEFDINQMEEYVSENTPGEDFHKQILKYKKRMLLIHAYYEQLAALGETLAEDENELFDDKNLRYFKIFTDKVIRLQTVTDHIRENLVQVQDAYQSALDYNLNKIMKMFTVVTTIFLPLTLIVGWYGMNFTGMPELSWKYGYAAIIVFSMAVVLFCVYIFKKKKLM